MKRMRWVVNCAFGCGLAAAGVPALAAVANPLGSPVQKINHWTVYARVDPMTDRLRCTARYDDQPDVELVPGFMTISFATRGGLSAFNTRLDDAPAQYQFANGPQQDDAAIMFGEGKLMR